ncbi:hypothetical protein HAX54_030252, partial [Datura stramonium]|nr:hypothetical protein [Datura stramonium]
CCVTPAIALVGRCFAPGSVQGEGHLAPGLAPDLLPRRARCCVDGLAPCAWEYSILVPRHVACS